MKIIIFESIICGWVLLCNETIFRCCQTADRSLRLKGTNLTAVIFKVFNVMFSLQGIMFVVFKNYFYKTIFGEEK